MTSKEQQKTVIAGEASESDDDESSVNDTAPENDVIQGEGVESENEDEQVPFPPLQVDPNAEGDQVVEQSVPDAVISQSAEAEKAVEMETPRYDTLLHKKLRERNASLFRNLGEYMSEKYGNNTKDVKEITKKLAKSQLLIQDVSHNLRLLTNDLFQLEDRIGLVTTSDILPVINLQHTPPPP